MYRTIEVSSCVLIQGEFVEVLDDGQIVIRDGQTEYRGRPIAKRAMQLMADALARPFEAAAQTA